MNNPAGTEPKDLFVPRGINAFYIEAGGFIRLEPPSNGTISARIGVSFISIETACTNVEAEIPGPEWNFQDIRSRAEDAWREKLSVVSIEAGGASEDLVTNFYSAVYRTMMSPQNYTGGNSLCQSDEPYFDSFTGKGSPFPPPFWIIGLEAMFISVAASGTPSAPSFLSS